jgi:hypothetical protein
MVPERGLLVVIRAIQVCGHILPVENFQMDIFKESDLSCFYFYMSKTF